MKLTHEERKILLFIRHYPEWVAEVETLADMRSAITYDADHVQTSPMPDEVFNIALRIENAQRKIDWVENALSITYRTDGMISKMRQVWCYKKHDLITKSEMYRHHKVFAQTLLRTYKKGDTNEQYNI